MRNWLAVIGFVFVALIVGVCTACSDDDNEESWVPAVESSERPGGRDGPGRDGEEEDGCSDQCGQHRDCENNSGECSDDDRVWVGPICIEPDSCSFG